MSDDFTNFANATESFQTTVLIQNQGILLGVFLLVGIALFIAFRTSKLR